MRAGPRPAAALEDLGWFVIDNMPSALMSEVAELVRRPGTTRSAWPSWSGRGGGDLEEALPPSTTCGPDGTRVQLVFLDAPDDVLVRRFEGTRRRHPS